MCTISVVTKSYNSWLHRAQIGIEAILAQGERCHDGKSGEVLGAEERPQTCVGAGAV